jgi:hypothetical protein
MTFLKYKSCRKTSTVQCEFNPSIGVSSFPPTKGAKLVCKSSRTRTFDACGFGAWMAYSVACQSLGSMADSSGLDGCALGWPAALCDRSLGSVAEFKVSGRAYCARRLGSVAEFRVSGRVQGQWQSLLCQAFGRWVARRKQGRGGRGASYSDGLRQVLRVNTGHRTAGHVSQITERV